MTELTWSVSWETELADAAHGPLAALLARAYAGHAARFTDGRSWAGARPELRVVARDAATPVAHAGIVRRFLRALPAGPDVLVGDVGLVAVDPEHHHRGLGTALMARVVDVLVDLDVPFGFVSCGPDVEPFYRAAGWTRLPGVAVHLIDTHHRLRADTDPTMVHAAGRPLSAWPAAQVFARDGQLV
ncbi:GNAT family N-acetyltransferase [Actinomycetospora lutea]|uniref:GNAT family N-acetyltransferase n=1 Tax=Actinomycetospora lutea TaxID=663604 RepID=UPI0023658958|nr:GNAT family N-acetyltransferase [Actinomycetospora lutea]MDD7937747.1 GNAT family N-acetyltransferase [Actinomycetospora lutea]